MPIHGLKVRAYANQNVSTPFQNYVLHEMCEHIKYM